MIIKLWVCSMISVEPERGMTGLDLDDMDTWWYYVSTTVPYPIQNWSMLQFLFLFDG